MSQKGRSFIVLVVLVFLYFFSAMVKVDWMEALPLCFFKNLTHLDCPGCGLMRSFISFSHGQWLDAVRYNALGPLIYIYLLLYLLREVFFLVKGADTSFSFSLPKGSWAYLLFGFLFWGQWFLKLSRDLFIHAG